MTDLIPVLTLHVLDLFRGPLQDVRFPDADSERLTASVDAVIAANDLVTHAQAALDAARDALAEKQRLVAQETERTIAYARIYAAERPDLRAAIDAASESSAPRRTRGRPRKVAPPPPSSDVSASAAE